MRAFGLLFFSFVLLLAAAITLACGSSRHTLQSVTVSPSTADAQAYGGQVQFTATGLFETMPSPVTPLSVTWSTCNLNGAPSEISVSPRGMAHCNSGAVGTYIVSAVGANPGNGGAVCAVAPACGFTGPGCNGSVYGAAKLTCP